LLEFGLHFSKICKFVANFWRNFVSALQPGLIGYGIHGGKGDGGGRGVFDGASLKLAKSFQFGAGLRPNLVSLSSALTSYYGKDGRIAFSSRKRSLFVPIVTVFAEIGTKSLRK
jgi:hypothetical protein